MDKTVGGHWGRAGQISSGRVINLNFEMSHQGEIPTVKPQDNAYQCWSEITKAVAEHQFYCWVFEKGNVDSVYCVLSFSPYIVLKISYQYHCLVVCTIGNSMAQASNACNTFTNPGTVGNFKSHRDN